MQDQYTGDFGDFVKYGLLRALSEGRQRTFFICPQNPDGEIVERLMQFAIIWQVAGELIIND